MPTGQTAARGVLIALALVWIGMLLGVSFLATPVKFLAPSLSLTVALDVGRQTFGVFSRVEVFATITLLTAAVLSREKCHVALALPLGGLVAAQYFWLLPALDARVEILLQGGTVADSSLHTIYIAIDLVKLFMLGILCWLAFSSFPRVSGSATNAQ